MSITAHSSMRGMRILRLLVLAVLVLGIIANPMDQSQAAPGGTLTVCATGCDHTSIQAAVIAASAGDTIQIVTSSSHTEYDIVINRDVTIEGAGDDTSTVVQAAATQAAATDRVFYIASGTTATIQNLTIQHGNSTDGAGIYNAGTLTLNNVIVQDNQKNGIYNSGTLTVNDGDIFENDSGNLSDGGGIYNTAGGVATLIDTSISNNTAHARGGGIYNEGTLYIENSLIESNIGEGAGLEGRGGGIHNRGDLTIIDSTIQGNRALNDNVSYRAYGGGIYSLNGIVQITNSVIEANYGAAVNTGLFGGGMYIADGEVEISGSTISGNYQTENGGGLYITGGALVDIDNSTIANNNVDETGGGIFIANALSSLNLLNTTISGNIANQDGGGVCLYSSSGQLTNSTISGNQAKDNGAGLYLFLQGSNPVYLNNLTITNNRARTDQLTGEGGGIYIDGASTQPVHVQNSILANNYRGLTFPIFYDDCNGTLNSLDYNLIRSTIDCTITGPAGNDQIGFDPQLGTLGDNGGPTQTHMPLTGSLAVDKANPGGCKDETGALLNTDQRGRPRPADGDASGGARCDIGAVEYASNPIPAITSLNPPSTQVGGGDFTLTVTGSEFVNGAVVRWNGTVRTTTLISTTQLSAEINAADIASQGAASITVLNPAPGGGVSNALEFSITPPTGGYKIYLPLVVRND